MKARLNIVYDNLLLLLQEYTINHVDYPIYEASLPNQMRKDKLFELSEKVANYLIDINSSMGAVSIHNNFQPLTTVLSEMKMEFNDYPANRFNEVLVIIKIINIIEQEITGSGSAFDLTIQIDETIFCLEQITRPIRRTNFLYEDPSEIENSIILLHLSDLTGLEDFIDQSVISLDLLFHLLIKLGQPGQGLSTEQYVLIRAIQQGRNEAVFSCAALHLVKAGKLVHQPVNYTDLPTVSPSRRILSNKQFQQFSDSLIILSEYNSQQDILDKYLRLYHLIEHFMFRKPIVELERRQNNLPFSIRDFRNLYKSVEQSEAEVLKGLLKTVMSYSIELGITFKDKIFTDWQTLNSTHIPDVNNINRLFDLMLGNGKTPFSYITVNAANLPDVFYKLVYAFRNSIVHNKATEFHLNHETMTNHHETGNAAQIVIEKFLLPCLEQISFYLIIEDNDLVWYHNPHLTLFNA